MKKKELWNNHARRAFVTFAMAMLVLAGCRKITDPPGANGPEEEAPKVQVSFTIRPPEAAAHVTITHNNALPATMTDGTLTAHEGDAVSFDIAEAARVYLGTVTVDAQAVSEFPHTLTVAAANIDVEVLFNMEKHAVNVQQAASGGSATVSPAEAYPLETVTIALKPEASEDDTHWFLETLSVTKTGAEAAAETVDTVKVADNTYTFIMPNFSTDVAYGFSRTISTNALLASLAPSAGSLNKPFSAAETSYEVTLGPDTEKIGFAYATQHADALPVLSVDDARVLDPLPAGITTVRISVTAQDGTTEMPYEVVISKSPSADLSSLGVSGTEFSGYPYMFNQPVAATAMRIDLPYDSAGVYDNKLTLSLRPLYPTASTRFQYEVSGVLTSVAVGATANGVTTATVESAAVAEGTGALTGFIKVKADADGLLAETTYTLTLQRRAAPAPGISGADKVVVYYNTEDSSWYEAYIFTKTGSMGVTGTFNDVLLFAVGGGQGGGGTGANGDGSSRGYGGAGAAVVQQTATLSTGAYTVTVGAGGTGGTQTPVGAYSSGGVGSATTISGIGVNISAAGGSGTKQTNTQSASMPNGAGCGSYGYSGQVIDYGYANGSYNSPNGPKGGNQWNLIPLANSGQGGGTRTSNYNKPNGNGRGVDGAAGIVIVHMPAR